MLNSELITTSNILRFIIPVMYGLVAFAYLNLFLKNGDKKPVYSDTILFLATILHLVFLFILYNRNGHFPARTVFEGLFLCSLFLVFVSKIIEIVTKEDSFGAFLFPIIFLIVSTSLIFINSGSPLPEKLFSVYFLLHVIFVLTSYTCFFFTFSLSIMYLMQHKELKSHNFDGFYKRLPSLGVMDKAIMTVNLLGSVMLIIGTVMGFYWTNQILEKNMNLNIKILFTLITLLIYLFQHLMRITKGWSGPLSCKLSIAGFLSIILSLLVGSHGY